MAPANDNSPAVLGTFFKDAGLQRRFQHREKNAGSILDQVRRPILTTPEIIPVAGYGRLKAELNIELVLCALSTGFASSHSADAP